MDRILGAYAPHLYAILRIVAGAMFALHGSQKLFGTPPGGPTRTLPPMLQAAGIIELVCGILIAIGLLTGWAAFLASGEMVAAFFIAHAPRGLMPLTNGGELVVLYCFLFLYMAARGAGPLSVDAAMGRSRMVAAHAR